MGLTSYVLAVVREGLVGDPATIRQSTVDAIRSGDYQRALTLVLAAPEAETVVRRLATRFVGQLAREVVDALPDDMPADPGPEEETSEEPLLLEGVTFQNLEETDETSVGDEE